MTNIGIGIDSDDHGPHVFPYLRFVNRKYLFSGKAIRVKSTDRNAVFPGFKSDSLTEIKPSRIFISFHHNATVYLHFQWLVINEDFHPLHPAVIFYDP
ncbi:hypothetical protein ES703_102411 [subsurface metagenome]